MAEFDALDGRLRDALGRAAEPGDSTGVADAIRARVAAGDPGASVAGSTAPGWAHGAWSWLPWLGMVVVAGLVGGVVGLSGAVGRPAGDTTVDVPVALGESVPASSCIEGPVVGRLPAGARVLAVQRSDDSLWVGVRDPGALGGTVWVALGDVTLDAGTPALETLPVGGDCPATVVTTPAPQPDPEPVPTGGPGPAPQPGPGDTAAPTIAQWWANPTEICADPQSGWSTVSTVSALAVDNVGVTSVRASWTQFGGGTADLALAAGTWSFGFDPPSGSQGVAVITLVARDAAGNESAPRSINVQVWALGSCLI